MQLSFAPTAPVAWILTLKLLISKALLNTLRDQISGKHLLKDLSPVIQNFVKLTLSLSPQLLAMYRRQKQILIHCHFLL